MQVTVPYGNQTWTVAAAAAQAHKKAEEEREESGFELRMIIAERKNTRAGAGYDHASASSITSEESI